CSSAQMSTIYSLFPYTTLFRSVWIACNTVVIGGVHIGNNVVIGAGSVVTKDIPDNYLAFGNPCRPVRPITEKDSKKELILPEDRDRKSTRLNSSHVSISYAVFC